MIVCMITYVNLVPAFSTCSTIPSASASCPTSRKGHLNSCKGFDSTALRPGGTVGMIHTSKQLNMAPNGIRKSRTGEKSWANQNNSTAYLHAFTCICSFYDWCMALAITCIIMRHASACFLLASRGFAELGGGNTEHKSNQSFIPHLLRCSLRSSLVEILQDWLCRLILREYLDWRASTWDSYTQPLIISLHTEDDPNTLNQV